MNYVPVPKLFFYDCIICDYYVKIHPCRRIYGLYTQIVVNVVSNASD